MAPDILPTSPLNAPPHSEEHNRTNRAVETLQAASSALNTRLSRVEDSMDLAGWGTYVWTIPDEVHASENMVPPLYWNFTGEKMTYRKLKATVLTPPLNGEIKIDIVNAGSLGDPATSILSAPLVIRAGQYESDTYSGDLGEFLGNMLPDTFVGLIISETGADPDTGSGLTVQLDRVPQAPAPE